ncbi:MAG: TorF family putative porin [Pseudomonadota bacterium]
MRFSMITLGGLMLAAATPAMAQEETEPAPEITVNGSATVVSDYRFRGISQTNKKVALQGGLTVTHSSGLYVAAWGSSVDDYIAAGSDQELDLIAGYSHTFDGGIKIDGGVLYYYYPGGGSAPTDFFEPYFNVSSTFGPVTAKVGVNYAPKADALSVGAGKEDNFYVAGDLSASIPNTPLGLTAHLGHTFGPSYLSIGDEYTDWSLGATLTWNHITAGIAYVDTNKDVYLGSRNLSGSGVVGSIGVSF